jgi:hypothetical protein
MTIWLHSTILATSIAATIAIGIASAAKYEAGATVAPKGDMLPVASETMAAPTGGFVTVEERGDGVSVLARIPADSLVE